MKDSADPQGHRVAVVVYVQNPDDVPIWRRLTSSAAISVARAGTDERRAPFRLHESVTAADIVIATDLALVLEALARAKPVIAWVGGRGDGDGDSELARFCRAQGSCHPLLRIAHDVQEAVACVSSIPGSEVAARAPSVARGDEKGTGAFRLYGLLDELSRRAPPDVTPTPPPVWQRLAVFWFAAMARRFDASRRP